MSLLYTYIKYDTIQNTTCLQYIFKYKIKLTAVKPKAKFNFNKDCIWVFNLIFVDKMTKIWPVQTWKERAYDKTINLVWQNLNIFVFTFIGVHYGVAAASSNKQNHNN